MFCARARSWLLSWLWFMTWLCATVFPAVVSGDDGMQSVSFREIEDDAVKVEAISFQHLLDKPFKNSKLRAAMKTVEGERFHRRFFRSDLNALENLYRGQGYMDVDIVRNAALENPECVTDPDIRRLVLDAVDEVRQAFQESLKQSRQSSHMWIVARRREGNLAQP